MTAMERSRILRRAVDILRNAMTNSQNWKPLTAEKHIRNLNRRYRYRCGRAGVLCRADPALEGSQIPLRETSFVYTRRNRWVWWRGLAHGTTRSRLLLEIRPSAGGRQCNDFQTERSTPLTALKLAEIYSEAGLPDGYLTCCRAWARRPDNI